MPLPYLVAFAAGLLAGIAIAIVLWAACRTSGRLSEPEQPLEE